MTLINIDFDKYLELKRKADAVDALARAFERNSLIDREDFYVCTGIKIYEDGIKPESGSFEGGVVIEMKGTC